MEFASYLAGERWSDHPVCTHPALAALARDVNDLSTDHNRQQLVPLITRVVGLTGPQREISATIALRSASLALPVASMERQRVLASGILLLLPEITDAHLRSFALAALAESPDSESWARVFLATMPVITRTNHRRDESIIHTAVMGIAQACVEDTQTRLVALLDAAIGDVEALLGSTADTVSRRSDRAFATA
jgi:hypothetical protein